MHTFLLDLLPPRDRLIAQLRLLERSIASYGLHVPVDVQRRYDLLSRELELYVSDTDATDTSSSTAWANTSLSALLTPEQRFAIEPLIQHELASLQQTIQSVSKDLPTLPAMLVPSAHLQVEEAQVAVDDLLTEWRAIQPLGQTTDERVIRLVCHINQTANKLHLLSLREIYVGNLGFIQQQLIILQAMPLLDKQRSDLENSIRLEQQGIQEIEARPDRDPSKEVLLVLRQQNLQWYREMLVGERPTVPIYVLHAQARTETKLQAIDAELMQALSYNHWRSGPTRHCS